MFPRKAGSAWEIFAPAKLNLYLNVLGLRPDGFHDLETLMVPVQLYDSIVWNDSDQPINLKISNPLRSDLDICLQNTSQNLVLRAAQLLANHSGVTPRGRFTLTKRIPIQAGMGGGSSDAAATLLLANTAWGLNYSREQLHSLAEQLGSDIPFFLYNSPALCRGRGELINPLSQFPKLHFVVIKPPVSLSTSEVFSQVEKFRRQTINIQDLVNDFQMGDYTSLKCKLYNALETPAARLTSWISRLKKILESSNSYAQLLTGSGSAYFGIMRSAVDARITAKRLASLNLGTVFATSTC